jgi:membrane fusion protein
MSVPTRQLFRQEVIEFQQQDRQWGRVVPLQPLPTRLMVWFVTACVAAVISFLFLAEYARKETVSGFIAPAAGTARVSAARPGIISAVHVRQGDLVTEGQPLLTISAAQVSASGEDVDAAILATLARQREWLDRQLAGEERRAVTEEERLRAQMQALDGEIGFLETQIRLQRERIAIVERMVASAVRLAPQGWVSEIEHRRREEALLEQRLSLSSLNQQLISRRSTRDEARFALEQLPAVTAERLQGLRNQVAENEQRRAEVDGRRAFILRAPVAGRVALLQAAAGQPADTRHAQVQIVPEDTTLQVELLIPARAIGFVAEGQEVRILYDAFPYQHFGAHRGRILRVSQAMLAAAETAGPLTLPGPAYRAVAEIERPWIEAHGNRVPLQPDMLLRADIILERRTLMDWILEPLRSARFAG